MSGRLAGKTAVITGAAGGQGRAGALLFAREGANLALTDVDAAGLEETAELVSKDCPGVAVLTYPADLRVLKEIEDFIRATESRHDAIDIIYHNAGVNYGGSIEDVTEADWDRVHDINLKSGFFLVKYALPALVKSGGGCVINVSSGAGLLAFAEGQTLYCSSKGGAIALTRAQARDLAPHNIRVNCLLPGPIATPMANGFFAAMPEEKRAIERDRVLSRSMLKRFGQPEEVAAVALFLATAGASYMTGAIIPVDAGWTSV
jgi:NAD(P)-dependent dehydrogenase (short-subunit alcohol dehydrogenase family)